MHERSLVGSLLRQVEAVRVEQHGLAVEAVRIEIGPLAGVEPLLVQSAFAELASACDMTGTSLIIEEVPLSARCTNCGVVEVSSARIACPKCGSTTVRVVSGDEVRLKSITIRHADDTEALQ